MKIWQFCLSLFSENHCIACHKKGEKYCQECRERVILYEPYCYYCKQKSDNFRTHNTCQQYFPLSQCIVVTHYKNPQIKRLLRLAKYHKKSQYYKEIVVSQLPFFQRYISWENNALLVPVPMHFFRKIKRGWNHAQILAQNIWDNLSIPVNSKFIKKSRYTSQQSHKSREERLKNLSGSFRLSEQPLSKNSPIYLVDDIISTGTTITEIAKLLKNYGFQDIRAIILASD